MTEKSVSFLEKFMHASAKWIGSSKGFLVALFFLLVWIYAGSFFHFSNQWENLLGIYIGIITYFMVFITQRAQNKELMALHLKLNELIASSQNASNQLINIEKRTEKELQEAQEMHIELLDQK